MSNYFALLIFYAGHGYYDNLTQTGFWIPSDGGYNPFKQENWIPHQQIKGSIQVLEAKHILLLSDSCFAGDIIDMYRGEKNERPEPDKEYIINAINKLSREVIASGGMELVRDKSEFAALVKMALKSNEKSFFNSIDLYQYIQSGVSSAKPVYGILPESKHQGGFFYFYRQSEENPLPNGTLRIAVRKPGTLFINGKLLGPIQPATQVTKECPPGNTSLMVCYDDGSEEMREVDVKSGSLQDILFIGFTTMRDRKKNYFICSAEFGLSLPRGFWGDVSELGFGITISTQYAFRLPIGYLFCGMLTGVTKSSIQEDLTGSFTFFTFPMGATVGYMYQFFAPFSLFIAAGSGMAVSLPRFDPPPEDQNARKSFLLSLTGGIGVSITRMIDVSLYGRISCLVFNNINYLHILPGVRIDIFL